MELISTRCSLREISCKISESALVKTQVDHIQVVKEPEKGKGKINILSLNTVLLTVTCTVKLCQLFGNQRMALIMSILRHFDHHFMPKGQSRMLIMSAHKPLSHLRLAFSCSLSCSDLQMVRRAGRYSTAAAGLLHSVPHTPLNLRLSINSVLFCINLEKKSLYQTLSTINSTEVISQQSIIKTSGFIVTLGLLLLVKHAMRLERSSLK